MGRFCSPCAPPTLRPGHGDFPRWFNRRCLNQNVEKKISRSNFPDHHLAKSWNPNHWTQIIFWKINIVLIMFGYMIHYGLLMFNIHIVSHPTSPSLPRERLHQVALLDRRTSRLPGRWANVRWGSPVRWTLVFLNPINNMYNKLGFITNWNLINRV